MTFKQAIEQAKKKTDHMLIASNLVQTASGLAQFTAETPSMITRNFSFSLLYRHFMRNSYD
jgi:hypothetical protein